ncbi:aminoacyl-tRNA deacylase [Microbacterium sp. YY-01]|uniref:aminoacyl-tRNA deacylase n=1 Tax=Microbacterium sp. YY-01 TaxID=3421634 RepID=UPI003D16A0B6
MEIRSRPAASSLAEAAAGLGIAEHDIVKTIVVKRHTPQGAPPAYLFALVPGGRRISWARLRTVVGVNKLRMPEPELALEATGYERGAIVPIGSTHDWPVFAGSSIIGRRIAMGAGTRGYSLFVDADDLIAAYNATVADISEPEERA